MSLTTGITSGTPSKIQFGAGVYFAGVNFDPKVAPSEEQVKLAIIGATQDGGTVTITPEFFEPTLDGANVSVKELIQKIGETAKMETSIAEMSANFIGHAVIGETGTTTDAKYEVITSSEKLASGHFYSGFGFWGEMMDGRPVIIIFKNALCTSGFSSENKNKTNTVFKGTFECKTDIEFGVTKLPYAIFIRKSEGWQAVDASEVTDSTDSTDN